MDIVAKVGITLCRTALGGKECPCFEKGSFSCADEHPGRMARAALAAMLEAVGEPVEGGLRCASSWLEHHAQHVGRCVGDSACTCGLVRIRLDVSLGLYSLAALREEV